MISRMFTSAMVALGLAVLVTASASAQQEKCSSIVLPNGTVLSCSVINGTKVYVDPAGNVYNATSTGVGQFTVVNTGTNPCKAALDVNSINITSTEPVLGTITTVLDLTRRSQSSTIQSNQIGAQFPATEDIYFYAEATVSSRPGIIYRSRTQLHLSSTQVTSFNPHVNERFNLAGSVDFVDINQPDRVAFTLRTLNITLNGR